jgi:hypothetical protein
VRGAVPAVAGGERQEGGEAPEDRPLMEGDRRSWYAHQLPFLSLSHHVCRELSVSDPLLLFRNLRWLGRETKGSY